MTLSCDLRGALWVYRLLRRCRCGSPEYRQNTVMGPERFIAGRLPGICSFGGCDWCTALFSVSHPKNM